MNRETLTSRERVLRTFNRQPVDRYPIDLGSHISAGISGFEYRNLRKYLGLVTDNIVAMLDSAYAESFYAPR